MQADECDRQCVREPAQCSLRRRGRREITGPRDVTCVSYWAGARPLDSTTQDTGPRGAFCSRGVWGLPGCLSVRPAVKIHSFTTLAPLPSAVADEQTLSRSLVHVVFEGAGIIHAEQLPHECCGFFCLRGVQSCLSDGRADALDDGACVGLSL